MGRKPSLLVCRRVQVRLNSSDAEIFDRYNAAQLSEIMSVALRTVTPGSKLGVSVNSILRPKDVWTETIARIGCSGNNIEIFFPEKLDEFKSVVKNKCGFVWDVWRWVRNTPEKHVCDHMAEVAYRLLEAGFVVQIQHSEVVKKVVSVSYIPEPLHLVKAFTRGQYEGWFTFDYPKGEDWYTEIMKLTAARYDSGVIAVPPEHYAEVEDFAEVNGFQFSVAALKVAEEWRQIRDVQQLIELKPRSKTGKNKRRSLPESSAEIPEGLLDD
jgi:hypothetical protein